MPTTAAPSTAQLERSVRNLIHSDVTTRAGVDRLGLHAVVRVARDVSVVASMRGGLMRRVRPDVASSVERKSSESSVSAM